MRFLLHSKARDKLARCTTKGRIKNRNTNNATAEESAAQTKESMKRCTPQIKAWGQQCSPKCGCIIRFETTIDPTTQAILTSTYHTKKIWRDSNNYPIMTTTNRPILQTCQCDTLNELGKEVANYLPNKTLEEIRNMTEFESVRSSPAFRKVVLQKFHTNHSDKKIFEFQKDIHSSRDDSSNASASISRENCYDVMEEAFLAMVRGHMPLPRREENKLRDNAIYATTNVTSAPMSSDMNNEDNTKASLTSSPGLDALVFGSMLSSDWRKEFPRYDDDDDDDDPNSSAFSFQINENKFDNDDINLNMDHDWLSYVDSQYQNKDDIA